MSESNPAGVGAGYDPNALDEELGSDARGVRQPVLPDGYYPVEISLRDFVSSREKGTPGLYLIETVYDGPWEGTELRNFDTREWLTFGDPAKKGNMIGIMRHKIEHVTGQKPDAQAFVDFQFPLAGVPADQRTNVIKSHFAGLSAEQRKDFMAKYARVNAWDKKRVIVALSIEQEEAKNADGSARLDDNGNQIIFDRNRVNNYFALNDAEHGINSVKKQYAKQAEEKKAMDM